MALSENVNPLAHTVDKDLISIGALKTDNNKATESILPHGQCYEGGSSATGVR